MGWEFWGLVGTPSKQGSSTPFTHPTLHLRVLRLEFNCLPSQSVSEKHNQEQKNPWTFVHLMNFSNNLLAMFENHKIFIFWLLHVFAVWSVFCAQFTRPPSTRCAKDHGLFYLNYQGLYSIEKSLNLTTCLEKPLNLTACLKKSLNCDRSPWKVLEFLNNALPRIAFKNQSRNISEPHLTISPEYCFDFARLRGVACLVKFLLSMSLFLELLHTRALYNGKNIWVKMAETWTSVIFSPWKIKTCTWKVLEVWFDKVVRTLNYPQVNAVRKSSHMEVLVMLLGS